MTINRGGGMPPTPTLPTGIEVASFQTYLEAQHAVDALSDRQFPVQHTVIVGTDLRMVERITGRLSYPRVALAGAMSGAWFGLFVGLIFGLFSENFLQPLIPALLIGAAFGILFGLVSYAFTGGKRDFTSSSQVVAGRYALLCDPHHAGEARRLIAEAGVRSTASATAAPAAPTPPSTTAHPAPEQESTSRFTPWVDEHGNPLYGQRADTPAEGVTGEPGSDEKSPDR